MSLRGHIQRQILLTPFFGFSAMKRNQWKRSLENIRKSYHRWAYRVQASFANPDTMIRMQRCIFPAALIRGVPIRTCKFTRWCPWCWARQAAHAFDLLTAQPPPADHVAVAFLSKRWKHLPDNEAMSPPVHKRAIDSLGDWIGDFTSKKFRTRQPCHGAVLSSSIISTNKRGVSGRRFGVAIIHRDDILTWQRWQNREDDIATNFLAVYPDASHNSLAKAVVKVFRFPKALFNSPRSCFEPTVRLRRDYRFFRTVGACFNTNLDLKEPTDGLDPARTE
jgi:hypothetical protein